MPLHSGSALQPAGFPSSRAKPLCRYPASSLSPPLLPAASFCLCFCACILPSYCIGLALWHPCLCPLQRAHQPFPSCHCSSERGDLSSPPLLCPELPLASTKTFPSISLEEGRPPRTCAGRAALTGSREVHITLTPLGSAQELT